MPRRIPLATIGLVAVGGALVCLVLAPFAMPADYSLLADTVSKAAGQGVPRGWITKSGFVLTGIGAICFAFAAWPRWGRSGTIAHGLFAAAICSAAWFETRPWRRDAPFDPIEHNRHSDASNIAAAIFALCILLVLWVDWPVARWRLTLGAASIAASAATPILMSIYADVDGLLERAWFVLAFAWWIALGVTLLRAPNPQAGGAAWSGDPGGS